MQVTKNGALRTHQIGLNIKFELIGLNIELELIGR